MYQNGMTYFKAEKDIWNAKAITLFNLHPRYKLVWSDVNKSSLQSFKKTSLFNIPINESIVYLTKSKNNLNREIKIKAFKFSIYNRGDIGIISMNHYH